MGQSNGPANKVFEVCLTILSRKTKHITSIGDLDSIPFNKTLKEMLAVELRVRKKKKTNKKNENKKEEKERINALPHSNFWIIRRKRKKVAPFCITPPRTTPPQITPPQITPLQISPP